jgi:enoyl-CoA hydratase/carnithine racemase
MEFVQTSMGEGIVKVALSRGKVNALNEQMVVEISSCFRELVDDHSVRAIILTGVGKFFSFGFDIPEFLTYSKESFAQYLTKFTDLYTYLFLYPKPVIAALNGHAIAGGCMLVTACDYRIIVSEKAKISLNEISFGSSLLAGSVEMLKFCVGGKNAERIIYSGAMYSAEEAYQLGLIDQIISERNLEVETKKIAQHYASKNSETFKSIKRLIRKPVAEEMAKREKESIREFVEIWYSENTWKNLHEIKIL